ncbi:MAG: acetoacetate decarboxylase [Rhodobacteraceae bacterium CG17_big_fil_post_rev_8_21_14_2_50_63_15]|nr:acetoacetate decarboxylase [Roseovarius sp.]PIV77429.1 MAG: acetoacetate decarboxylase [Rhodobacteraceae bacterium CG17_big_fil_post_rev_8_21_14_2_50_63_15]
MTPQDILALSAMPPANPSYPRGPYRFINREYLNILYQSDPAAIRAMVPEPLVPDGSDTVVYEWINMPDSSGFGAYQESGIVIPCLLDGAPVNYTAMMFLNNEPPITAGREIWGFPKRWGEPRMSVEQDTLTGTLSYAGQRVAMGTMVYKHQAACGDPQYCARKLAKTTVNLKIIPCVTGKPRIAELVAFAMTDITVKGFWRGPARLHLVPHVNAPVADLPVRRVIEGQHIVADLSLPYGKIVHDYLR